MPRVDVVLESVGKATWSHSVRSVRPGGTIVVAGATSGDAEPAELTRIFFQEITVVGTTMGTRDDLGHLLAFLARTGVRPLVDSTFALADARDARAAAARTATSSARSCSSLDGRRVGRGHPRARLPGADARAAARRRGRRRREPRPVRTAERRAAAAVARDPLRPRLVRLLLPDGLAEYWHARGAAFYALDLRKYGRSLRPGQTPGYVDDLETYDEEIEASLDVITADLGARARVMVMGHSTGGLVAALWAQPAPRASSAAWCSTARGSSCRGRRCSGTSAPRRSRGIARFQPKAPLPNIDPGYYARTLSSASGGEWTYDTTWRPTPSFPVRAGWLQAIMVGHARVARGLSIEAPILMCASSRTVISPRWSEDMRHADVVLDVELLARRAVQLGSHVTVVRIRDGLHDLALSPRPVRERFYAEIDRWSSAYGWG